jgi:very-short-patch-repair endonuclease
MAIPVRALPWVKPFLRRIMIKIPENVAKFNKQAVDKVGNYESEMFDISIFNEIQDYKIESPIEQILYIAMKSVMRICCIGDSDSRESINGNIYVNGVWIQPQFHIGKYRVDFLVSYSNVNIKGIGEQVKNEVIVECDSQAFHDRSESERRYEKKRDRDMQSLGYKVFRFTGSEIISTPMDIAIDILSFVTGKNKEEMSGEMGNF